MNITIFGATGLTGKELVNQALERDMSVVCLVRRELDVKHPRLKVINGSMTHVEQVEAALKDSDAVISVLGSAPKLFGDKSTDVYSRSAAVIVKAMGRASTRRLIFCSSAGVEEDPREIFFYKFVLKPLLLKKSYADMQLAEQTISRTDLDWVLVRPARLVKGTLTKKFRTSERFRPIGGSAISRPDLAFFLLNQVTDSAWIHKTPTITY